LPSAVNNAPRSRSSTNEPNRYIINLTLSNITDAFSLDGQREGPKRPAVADFESYETSYKHSLACHRSLHKTLFGAAISSWRVTHPLLREGRFSVAGAVFHKIFRRISAGVQDFMARLRCSPSATEKVLS
jgi:hypothetical protein